MERGCTPLKRSLRPVRSMYYVYIYIYTRLFTCKMPPRCSPLMNYFWRGKGEEGEEGYSRGENTSAIREGFQDVFLLRVQQTRMDEMRGDFFFFKSFSTASATTTVFWNVEQVISQEICIWNGAMIGIFSRRNREGIIYKFHEPPILIFFLSKFRKFHEPSFMLLIG